MSEIRVCGIAEAADVASAWGARAVMSLLTPRTPARSWRIPHLSLWFHDVSRDWLKPRRMAMTPEQMAEFVDFVRCHPGKLLVHCHLGLSRSPAAAIVACAVRGMAPSAAVAWLASAYPDANPNRRVIELGDRALDLDGDLVAAVANGFGEQILSLSQPQ